MPLELLSALQPARPWAHQSSLCPGRTSVSGQALLLPVAVAHETRALLRSGDVYLPGTRLGPRPWAEATGVHHAPHRQAPWWTMTTSEVTHSRHTVLGDTLSPPQPSPTSALPPALGSRTSTWRLLPDLEPPSAPTLQATGSSCDMTPPPHRQQRFPDTQTHCLAEQLWGQHEMSQGPSLAPGGGRHLLQP